MTSVLRDGTLPPIFRKWSCGDVVPLDKAAPGGSKPPSGSSIVILRYARKSSGVLVVSQFAGMELNWG
jgi:hypothetical protein